ncbi:MAG: hypothetical protein ACRDVG_03670 [Jatrophihabitantaceae bacterium]
MPDGPILAVATADLNDKDALLASKRPGFFTIPHFDGYAAVLVQLREVDAKDLENALVDAWLVHAPEAAARAFVAERY